MVLRDIAIVEALMYRTEEINIEGFFFFGIRNQRSLRVRCLRALVHNLARTGDGISSLLSRKSEAQTVSTKIPSPTKGVVHSS